MCDLYPTPRSLVPFREDLTPWPSGVVRIADSDTEIIVIYNCSHHDLWSRLRDGDWIMTYSNGHRDVIPDKMYQRMKTRIRELM